MVPSISKVIDDACNMRTTTNCSQAIFTSTKPSEIQMALWIKSDIDVIFNTI
jgi:hypothetical protein